MERNYSSEEILDLLHHRRSDRYVINTANIVESFLFTNCFTDVEIEGLDRITELSRNGHRLIFIPNHQSEYDWMLLQTYLAQRYIRTAIQAGENLYVGPIGTFLKKCGAFMAIRDQRVFYSKSWLTNSLFKLLGRDALVISRDRYTSLYLDQIKRVVNEGLHLMIFPGYENDIKTGAVKYGRSYSGHFSELSAYIFVALKSVMRHLEIENALYVPVNISYERVPEDIVFREYQASSKKGKLAKYIYDHYYAFGKVPFARRVGDQRSRVLVRFGKGIPLDKKQRAKDTAKIVWKQMGKLMRVYESNLIFASLDNRFKMDLSELEDKVSKNLNLIETHGLDTSPLYTANKERLPLENMLTRTVQVFNSPQVPIIPSKSYLTIEYDEQEIFIHNPHLASYYGSKLKHILPARVA